MKQIKGLKSIRESFKTKQVKFGGYAALISVAVLAGLILINLIIGQFPFQIDMTEYKVFSLSEQTIQVLEQVNSPVNIYGLWSPGQENSDVTEVLDLYLARNKNLRFEVIDPDRNPGFVMRFNRDRTAILPGSVIVEGEKGYRVISPNDMYEVTNFQNSSAVTGISVERRLTSALLYAGTGKVPVIYEITGHQEIGLAALGLHTYLDQENFELKSLNLMQSNVPADASILAIISPASDITRPEADKILDFLAQGGRLLVMADFQIQEVTMVNEILASYGLRFDYGIVMENDPTYTAGDVYVEVPRMEEHDILNPILQKGSTVVLPFAMGISETGTKRRTVGINPLLTTSANSWLRNDMYSSSTVRIPSDQSGPITMAVTVADPQYIQDDEPQARIVLIAASTVVSTPYGDFSIFNPQIVPGSNADLVMNSLTWLDNRPETLSARTKSIFILPMRLNGLQIAIYSGIFVIVIPLGLFIAGLIVWLRRRHL